MFRKLLCMVFGHKFILVRREMSKFQRLTDTPELDYKCEYRCSCCGFEKTTIEASVVREFQNTQKARSERKNNRRK